MLNFRFYLVYNVKVRYRTGIKKFIQEKYLYPNITPMQALFIKLFNMALLDGMRRLLLSQKTLILILSQ